jgi:archaellum biogenesis protein FlaJ (TadC family)
MKNIFESQLSKEQQNKLISNVKHRVHSALNDYHYSSDFTFDSLANKTDAKAKKIVSEVLNNMSNDISKTQKDPELQKKVKTHFKNFSKKHLKIQSYKNISVTWKTKETTE